MLRVILCSILTRQTGKAAKQIFDEVQMGFLPGAALAGLKTRVLELLAAKSHDLKEYDWSILSTGQDQRWLSQPPRRRNVCMSGSPLGPLMHMTRHMKDNTGLRFLLKAADGSIKNALHEFSQGCPCIGDLEPRCWRRGFCE